VVAAAFSFVGYPHSPEFPCKFGQHYSNKQEGKGNRMDKKMHHHQNMSAMPILN
jgi:hypothetical protein